MPRYFFHLRFGARVLADEEGVELSSRFAARSEALVVIGELADRSKGENLTRWAGWFVEVADDRGSFLQLPIDWPALKVMPERGPHPDLDQREAWRPGPARPGAALGRLTAAPVGELKDRLQRTAQLMELNRQLREELAAALLVSERIRGRARELLSASRVLNSPPGRSGDSRTTARPRAAARPRLVVLRGGK